MARFNGVAPDRFARINFIAGDPFLSAALLQRDRKAVGSGKGRPPRPDRPLPELPRRRTLPVASKLRPGNPAAPLWPEKLWKIVGCGGIEVGLASGRLARKQCSVMFADSQSRNQAAREMDHPRKA